MPCAFLKAFNPYNNCAGQKEYIVSPISQKRQLRQPEVELLAYSHVVIRAAPRQQKGLSPGLGLATRNAARLHLVGITWHQKGAEV